MSNLLEAVRATCAYAMRPLLLLSVSEASSRNGNVMSTLPIEVGPILQPAGEREPVEADQRGSEGDVREEESRTQERWSLGGEEAIDTVLLRQYARACR